MSSALPLQNLKYPLDYFKFAIGIIFQFAIYKLFYKFLIPKPHFQQQCIVNKY